MHTDRSREVDAGLGWEEGRATANDYGVSVLDLDNGKGAC